MAIPVRWLKVAESELDSIWLHISQESPQNAIDMILKITEAARDLGDYPLAGHVVEECGSDIFREYAVWPFRLIYRVKPDAIIILAIVHGAQQMPTQIFKRR